MIYKKYLYKAYLLQHIFTDIEAMIGDWGPSVSTCTLTHQVVFH